MSKRVCTTTFVLGAVCLTSACGDKSPDVEGPPHRFDVVVDALCAQGQQLTSAHMLGDEFVFMCTNSNPTGRVSSIVDYQPNSEQRVVLYERDPSPFFADLSGLDDVVLGSVVYLRGDNSSLYALRTDLGRPSEPQLIATGDSSFSNRVATETHLYWTTDQGVSRVLLSGGQSEHVADLPLFSKAAAIVGDSIYVVGQPRDAPNGAFAVNKVSVANKTATLLWSQPPGLSTSVPWVASHRDRVLWADFSAAVPKVYEIGGDNVELMSPQLDPAPSQESVLFGDLLAMAGVPASVPTGPSKYDFTLLNLETGAIRICQVKRAELGGGNLKIVGLSGNFIFVLNTRFNAPDRILRLWTDEV